MCRVVPSVLLPPEHFPIRFAIKCENVENNCITYAPPSSGLSPAIKVVSGRVVCLPLWSGAGGMIFGEFNYCKDLIMSSPVELSPKCQEHFKGRGLSKCGLNLANCSMSRAGFLFAVDQFGQDKAPKSTVNLPALSWMHCPFPHFYYNFFSGVFLHLRFFFMASLILNAMRKIGALTMSGNELCLRLDTAAAPAPFSWIFLDFSQPSDCLHLNHR